MSGRHLAWLNDKCRCIVCLEQAVIVAKKRNLDLQAELKGPDERNKADDLADDLAVQTK